MKKKIVPLKPRKPFFSLESSWKGYAAGCVGFGFIGVIIFIIFVISKVAMH